MTPEIAIIGAGAAGCFAAIELKRCLPEAIVTVYEASSRPLLKVSITGGGRCNLTNSFARVKSLESVYPRGARLMKRLFCTFSPQDTCRWFEREGVRLVTQEDQCVFPQSQEAMQIVHTLTGLMDRLGVRLKTGARVTSILPSPTGRYTLLFSQGKAEASQVLVATGGFARESLFGIFDPLQLDIQAPVPSLFSLNLSSHPITRLTGLVVEETVVSIPATKFKSSGPLLITHRGMSGPAVLKLSSYAARHLKGCDYHFTIAVNWLGGASEQAAEELLLELQQSAPQRQLSSLYPSCLPSRLWELILNQSGIAPTMRWKELAGKAFRKLVAELTHSTYAVTGKNRHKEEFVTCGGIALSNLHPQTLECKSHPGLFFAGEIMDVDAVTGGFNLQAAWSSGYVAAHAIAAQWREQQ